MFRAEYEKADITLGGGQVKLLRSRTREKRQGGTNWTTHARSSL